NSSRYCTSMRHRVRLSLVGTLLLALVVALSACGGSMRTVTVTSTVAAPTRPPIGAAVPLLVGLCLPLAFTKLRKFGFALLPVPTVPPQHWRSSYGVVY